MPRRVLLGGWYGAANFGDEALLATFVQWTREAGAEPVAISVNPAYTRRVLGIEALEYSNLPALCEAVARADVFVLGGGGLFQDYQTLDHASLQRFPALGVAQFAQFAHLALEFGLPTLALAQGVGPLNGAESREIVADLFSRLHTVSVRDAASAALLREIGVDRSLLVAPDPAWRCLVASDAHVPDERSSATDALRWLAVVPREWSFGPEWESFFAAALRDCVPSGWGILWIDFHHDAATDAPRQANALIEGLIARVGDAMPHRIFEGDSVTQAVGQIAQCDACVAMRLHAQIAALNLGLPTVAVEYDGKMSQLSHDVGLDPRLRVPLAELAGRLGPAVALATGATRSELACSPATIMTLRDAALRHRDLLHDAIAGVQPLDELARDTARATGWLAKWNAQESDGAARIIGALGQRLDSELTRQTQLQGEWTAAVDDAVRRADAASQLAQERKAANATLADQAEVLQNDSAALRLRVGVLEDGIARANADLAAASADRQALRSQLAEHSAALDAARETLEVLRVDFAAERAQHDAAKAALDRTNANLQSTQADLATASVRLEATRAEVIATTAVLEGVRRELETTHARLAASDDSLAMTRSALTSEQGRLADARNELGRTADDLKQAQDELRRIRLAHVQLATDHQAVVSSRSYRMTSPLRYVAGRMRRARELGLRAIALSHNEGVATAARVTTARLRRSLVSRAAADRLARQQMEALLARHSDRRLVVAPPLIDWSAPLFQRPQQLARALARRGLLYMYCVPGMRDGVNGFREIDEGLVLTDRFDLARELPNAKLLHVYSTDLTHSLDLLRDATGPRDQLVYEYIDELDPAIAGHDLPEAILERHRALLADPRTRVVVTADVLAGEVKALRGDDFALIPNGADTAHFSLRRGSTAIPRALQPIRARGKPVIGYYGALASWFDYDLIAALAQRRSDLEFVVIGYDLDGSSRDGIWARSPNVNRMGAVPYSELPRYAAWLDVGMIPFRRNNLTQATSPVKLFEYMAAGLPVVSTDLPECRKHACVLIGDDEASFAQRIDQALVLRDDAHYVASLLREAAAADWDRRAGAWMGFLAGERVRDERAFALRGT